MPQGTILNQPSVHLTDGFYFCYDLAMTLSSAVQPKEAAKIEETTFFLADTYRKSGHNPKPVVFHSLRVAYTLIELGYRGIPITSAILHDLLEDTDATFGEIEEKFGEQVALCVKSLTYDKNIKDPIARYKDLFKRTAANGKDACVVKAADIFDNMRYFELVDNKDKLKELIGKVEYFMECASVAREEPIFQMLQKSFEDMSRTLKKV